VKPFDDRLPEEQDPQLEELISLLQHANLSPIFVDPTLREEILSRTRTRLVQLDSRTSLTEDIPAIEMEGPGSLPSKSKTRIDRQYRSRRIVQLINNFAAVLLVAALIGSVIILKSTLLGRTGEFPSLTLSSHIASPVSKVIVTLKNFSPSTRVVLTHDIQEPITINGNTSITTDTQGNARFPLVIDTTWGPGFHLIVAEDVSSRSTASANLQITGEGTTPPAHLLIDTSPLNLGPDLVGTNTIRAFSLANSGGGSISWSASSDAPWLLVAPSQGLFSQQEPISLAVERLGLKPGSYHGTITLSSNVSPPQQLEVDMSVLPVPANAGPVLAVSPALLTFTATDGQPQTSPQTLTVSNPGSHPLQWTLNPVQGLTCHWLGVLPLSGTVPPGTTQALTVTVQSQCLLPGAYTGTLTFSATGALDSTQKVNVSVVIQPHCGLVTSTGFLAFTVVAGQNTLAYQSLSLNATASCAGTPLSWKASSTAPWLSVTPGSGQAQANNSSVVTASVNAGGLLPSNKPYYANLSFVFGQSSLTVMAKLMVQQAASPTAPIMSASPLSLNFTTIQGQPDPTGQVVTITNNGHTPLSWHATAIPFPSPSIVWFAASPLGGSLAPGQSAQVAIHVSTALLTPGNYVGQITLNGLDARGNPAPGSPQTIAVNLVMQSPCTFSPPSSSALSFSAVQGALTTPATQTVMFTGTGSCVWPLAWKTSVAPAASWLTQTASSGTMGGSGQSGMDGIGVNSSNLVAGSYSTTVTITASDPGNVTVQGGAQTFTVTLTILPPCVLSTPAPATLTLTLAQGQITAAPLTVGVKESGTCARPVTWHASTSSAWLALTATSGTDTGAGGSFGVNASAGSMLPGTYTGTITITATDSAGAAVGSAQSVNVTLTVIGFTVSGTVLACATSICTTPPALPGATVTLLSGSITIDTITADASGNYSFTNIPLGSYTITAAGYDASKTHYTGTLSLTLTGNALNTTIKVLPG
jgi:hypothetical protein